MIDFQKIEVVLSQLEPKVQNKRTFVKLTNLLYEQRRMQEIMTGEDSTSKLIAKSFVLPVGLPDAYKNEFKSYCQVLKELQTHVYPMRVKTVKKILKLLAELKKLTKFKTVVNSVILLFKEQKEISKRDAYLYEGNPEYDKLLIEFIEASSKYGAYVDKRKFAYLESVETSTVSHDLSAVQVPNPFGAVKMPLGMYTVRTHVKGLREIYFHSNEGWFKMFNNTNVKGSDTRIDFDLLPLITDKQYEHMKAVKEHLKDSSKELIYYYEHKKRNREQIRELYKSWG